jgi:hypothetical protein
MVPQNQDIPNGKEAEHEVYLIVCRIAIHLSMRIYRPQLSDFREPDDRLGVDPSAAFRHRFDYFQWLFAAGASQPLSSLFQPVGLGTRFAFPSAGVVVD